MLPYEDKIVVDKELFLKKLVLICEQLRIKPEWLMICMALETAKTFNPAIVNQSTNATGLIQFMPDTAKGLGTTVEALAKLKNYEQLDYVYAYFKPWTARMKSFDDVYLVIFYPAAVGKPDSYPFGLSEGMRKAIAKVNPMYDINKDGMVTKGEVKQVISKFVPAAWKDKI